MANSRTSETNKEYATVDSIPGLGGYFTNEVSIRGLFDSEKLRKIFFSIRESEADSSGASDTSLITVVLQFKCEGDEGWQEYVPLDGSTIAVGNRLAIEDTGAGVLWRAGVQDDFYTSGSITFGFDW